MKVIFYLMQKQDARSHYAVSTLRMGFKEIERDEENEKVEKQLLNIKLYERT